MINKKLQAAFVFLMVCMLHIGSITAQDKKLEKANEAYNKFAFIEAIKLYKAEIKKGANTVEVYTKLGDAYYYNANYPEAAQCYSKVVTDINKVDPEYYFRYAQALSNGKDYKTAEKVMKIYYSKTEQKDISENWGEKKLLENLQKQSGRYDIKAVEINTPASDFGTAYLGNDKVIYASAKDTGVIFKRKHSWNDKSFLKLYSADVTVDGGLQNPVLLKGDINTRYHQSTPVITKDGKTMYFTRNNYNDGKLGADKKGTTNLKINTPQNLKVECKNVRELGYPLNGDGFSSAHPALSPDETELYFVSDRNNKFGNSDLYKVSIKKGGNIGKDITRLGDEINTLGRETYPYMDALGILYFSSDGHPGLGGLDVFAAIKDDAGVYHVVNVGDGVNSSTDDFAYVFNEDTKKGYFSSNRSGNDDIYSFTQNKPIDFNFDISPIVFGTLKYTNGEPIEGMAVDIYNTKNEKLNTVYSDKDGKYSAKLLPFTEYKFLYGKPGLTQKEQVVLPIKPAEKREYSLEFINEMEVIVDNKRVEIHEGDNLTNKLNLKPIYFDYNGYKIRESSKAELDKIVEVMRVRPRISIQVNSHTDSRGKDDFNMKLSQNRAKATMDYIVAHGIEKDRVTAEGFGETRLINRCLNGVKCSDAEHQENRRSEFIIQINQK